DGGKLGRQCRGLLSVELGVVEIKDHRRGREQAEEGRADDRAVLEGGSPVDQPARDGGHQGRLRVMSSGVTVASTPAGSAAGFSGSTVGWPGPAAAGAGSPTAGIGSTTSAPTGSSSGLPESWR